MLCQNCGRKYWNRDEDAGTFLERFCSAKCEDENEKAIENYLAETHITNKSTQTEKVGVI